MLRGWENNHRSGVALAMRHGLSGLSTYGLNDQRMGDEHPAYMLLMGYGTLLPLLYRVFTRSSKHRAASSTFYGN